MLKLGPQQGLARRLVLPLTIILILTVLTTWLEFAEGGRKQAKPRRRIKKGRAGVGKDFSEFLLVIGVIMTCVIAPVFFFLLYSIYKDPATPELARACWKAVNNKLLSYLGQQPMVPGSLIDPSDRLASSSALGAFRYQALDTSYDRVTVGNSSNNNDHTNAAEASWAPSYAAVTSTRLSTVGTDITDRSFLAESAPPMRWRGTGGRGDDHHPFANQRPRLSRKKKALAFEPRLAVERDPHPDHDDAVRKEDQPSMEHVNRGVYKRAQSKRAVARSKRARAVQGLSAGEARNGR